MAVARFAIDARLEQGLLQAQPAQAHRQRQRRITGRRSRERIGATLQQFQRQLFQATGGLVVLRAGGQEARQPPRPAGDRPRCSITCNAGTASIPRDSSANIGVSEQASRT
jgi:hypothetical protein